ncbi:hypothetical protein A2Z41_03180 [Microgenomates group bacterium RBG_19FT_COMBO_39_10]|nr:MAG: hypothetical protein A2Z41_03180 [Microgenomates group bacterium RBG_19FT_COMBO_39_10]
MSEKLAIHPEGKFLADYIPERFTSKEEEVLNYFFSNLDQPIFIASQLPPSLVGALIARHSQSPHSMRRNFLEEFVVDLDDLHFRIEQSRQIGLEGALDLQAANALLEKNFVGFGHDSLAATIPLIVGFDRISQLAIKQIEDTRIGLSPVEKSTRYTDFGKKVDGRYLYARSPVIMASEYGELYEREIDANLDLYSELLGPVAEDYRRKFSKASEWQIKRMTFDTVRVLLVAANFTNAGVLVNGQAAENLIIKLKASELGENQELGQLLEEEIRKISPPLVGRFEKDFGQQAVEYRAGVTREAKLLAGEYLMGTESDEFKKGVVLRSYDLQGEDKVIAMILWPGCDLSNKQVLETVRQLSFEDKEAIVRRYVGQRLDRRIKPGRAFEEAILSYGIVMRFAEWRDLQRNRMLTPHWRIFNCRLGFDIGEDLEEFGYGGIIRERLEELAQAQVVIARDFPIEAQYLVPFGTLIPYEITLNFRELVYIAELRTGTGVHEGYARIASEMARSGKEAYPLLSSAFQFVNWR